MCDSDPVPAVLKSLHMWTEEESKAAWDHLPDDGIHRNLQFGTYKWDPAKNVLQEEKL